MHPALWSLWLAHEQFDWWAWRDQNPAGDELGLTSWLSTWQVVRWRGGYLLDHLLPDDFGQVDGQPVADDEDAKVPALAHGYIHKTPCTHTHIHTHTHTCIYTMQRE